MANAKIDSNGRPAIIATLNSDGKTIVQAKADPMAHSLIISDGTSGSDNGNNSGIAMLDDNSNPVWIAESSDGSGTMIEIYANSSQQILTKST